MRHICAPAGQVFICGLPTNPLPYDGHIQPSSPYPGKAIALKCLNNAWCEGQYTLGIMQNSSVGVTAYQATQPRSKRATGLILAGIGAAIGLAAPWGGFIYYEATVSNLSDTLYDLSQVTGRSMERLSQSLNSLAEVVMDLRRALDYFLAEQEGVCAVINKTCCTYINSSGLVEENIKKIYEQAKWPHYFGKSGPRCKHHLANYQRGLPNITWFLPLLGPAITFLLILLFGPCIINT